MDDPSEVAEIIYGLVENTVYHFLEETLKSALKYVVCVLFPPAAIVYYVYHFLDSNSIAVEKVEEKSKNG